MLGPVLTLDASSAGVAPKTMGGVSAGGARQETDCSQMNNIEQQQTPPKVGFVDVSSAAVRKQGSIDKISHRPRPLLASALDRRVCPEPVQVSSVASLVLCYGQPLLTPAHCHARATQLPLACSKLCSFRSVLCLATAEVPYACW